MKSAIITSLLLTIKNGVVAESIRPEHMRRDLPYLIKRDVNSSVSITVWNNCSETIWPGVQTQHGDQPSKNGFELQPGSSQVLSVSTQWQGRIWGRTNCSFPNGNAPRQACNTGDCAGALNCTVGGLPPVTLAEFTCDGGDGKAYYDISIVDGFNIGMGISRVPKDSSSTLSANATNPICVASLAQFNPNFNPYTNTTDLPFMGTDSSAQFPFVNGLSQNDVSQWCPWDCQMNPPQKPGAGVYPYPNGNIQRPIFQPCWSTCAKWNEPQDCCTGSYNSPSKCKPGLYSTNAKRICPDAYTYAYDDKDATFAFPIGADYEVVFCPPGRSTNIISNVSAIQKLHGGLTSAATSESPSLSWTIVVVALVLTAGFFSFM